MARGQALFDVLNMPAFNLPLPTPSSTVPQPIEFTLRNPPTADFILNLLRTSRQFTMELDFRAEMEMREQQELRERRDREVAQTSTKITVQIETGEKRERNSASRLFFVYVTPTGAEMPINRCPGLKKEWGRTNGAFDSESRQSLTEFTVQSPCTIKMVNLQSTFGRPKRVVNLTITVDPEAATIEVKGLEGFGMFKGRAKVDYEKSTYFVNRENFKITEAVLKEHFGLRVLQPPVKGGGGRCVRSLIFE